MTSDADPQSRSPLPPGSADPPTGLVQAGDEARALLSDLVSATETVVVGSGPLIEFLLLGLVAGGHVLLEGVPGTAKTLLARTFARLTGLPFRRLQLTPDLLPADITGTLVLPPAGGAPEFRPGPVFTGVLLADEANRAPPRTQVALLEAMEERQVTVDGTSHALDPDFTVLATFNHVEVEGTWPLPEAYLDRFLLQVHLRTLEPAQEDELIRRAVEQGDPRLTMLPQLTPRIRSQQLARLRAALTGVTIRKPVRLYLRRLVQVIRKDPRVKLGPSHRATVQLVRACQTRALLRGEDHVLPDDVTDLLAPVLAHRVFPHPEAALDGTSSNRILDDARRQVEIPR